VLHSRAMARYLLLLGPALLLVAGCDTGQRLTKLEKQNQELQAEIKKRDSAPADLESQAKCARDSKVWFNANWQTDKDTTLLNYTNHYSKSLNQCFILVEYHYRVGTESSWFNHVSLWNVYENSEYGTFVESHWIYTKPKFESQDAVASCKIVGKTCKTFEEFSDLARPYMSD
jgi:hypothetical protein